MDDIGRSAPESKVKNKIAWFSKKPKPSHIVSRPHRHQTFGVEKVWSSSAEDVSNRYVSQEELRVLRGCVSERRAIFSLNQKSLHFLSFGGVKVYNDQMGMCKNRCVSSADGLNRNQSSFPFGGDNSFKHSAFEPTHLQDLLSVSQTPDSVSVQFRSDSREHISTQNSDCTFSERIEVLDCSNAAYHFTGNEDIEHSHSLGINKRTKLKLGSRINGGLCKDQSINLSCSPIVPSQECMHSPLLKVSHDQSRHNSWPRNMVNHNQFSDTAEPHCTAYCASSPHHLEKHKPASIVSTDFLSLTSKIPEQEGFGSTSSVFSIQSRQSSVTSVSSCSERLHLSFVKGVNGVDFKQRTDVGQ